MRDLVISIRQRLRLSTVTRVIALDPLPEADTQASGAPVADSRVPTLPSAQLGPAPQRRLSPVPTTVLVTDGLQRKALSATRSLGHAGFRVLVSDRSVVNPARYSRYAAGALRSPRAGVGMSYVEWMRWAVRTHGVTVVLPIDDDSTSALVHHEVPGAVSLVPTPEQFGVSRDKLRTVELAERAGVPVPRAIGVSTLAEALAALEAIGGPAAIKARESSSGRGIAFVDSPESLRALWPSFVGRASYIQQRIVSGRRFDVCLLFDGRGRLRRQFVQEETRWFPTETSVSTVQRSVHRPDLVDLALRTLQPIGWRGFVELEYLEDAAGMPWLLEINPRLWSSVELAVHCGIDFPAAAVRLALGQHVGPDPGYAADVYCTWGLPGEALRRIRCFLKGDRQGQRRACPRGSHDNILSWEDPMPTLGVSLTVMRHLGDLSLWRQLFRRP